MKNQRNDVFSKSVSQYQDRYCIGCGLATHRYGLPYSNSFGLRQRTSAMNPRESYGSDLISFFATRVATTRKELRRISDLTNAESKS